MNTRALCATLLQQVIFQQHSLSAVLPDAIKNNQEDAALIQELCYGTLRYYYRLKPIADQLLLSPLKPKNSDLF